MKINKKSQKRFLIGGVIMILLATSVFAVWSLYVNTQSNAVVVSSEDTILYFSETFPLTTLNTTKTADTQNSTATLYNRNGNFTGLFFEANTTRIGTNELCPNFETDCEVEYFKDGVLLVDTIDLVSGDNQITQVISCLQNSCPQNLTSSITISDSV